MLAPDPDRDAAVRTGMIRESQAAVALNHPHILPVFEAGEADETVYVAMRYARGGDARSLLSRLGPLPPGYAWHIIAQIASALDAAHAHGLIHRDVKPTNILLDAGDPAAGHPLGQAGGQEPDHAYLSDFGMGQAFWPGRIIAAHQIGRHARITSRPSRSRAAPSTAGPTSTRWPAPDSSCCAERRHSGRTRA